MTREPDRPAAGDHVDAPGDGDPVRVAREDDVPDGGCLAVLDGRVLLARVDGELHAYRNQCLHKATPLDGGLVRDGIVTCPLHFWRYELATGANLAGGGHLERVPAWTEHGEVLVLPPPAPPTSLRALLRDHAARGVAHPTGGHP